MPEYQFYSFDSGSLMRSDVTLKDCHDDKDAIAAALLRRSDLAK